MSDIPENLRYTKDHEWARKEDDGTIAVGITAHAADQLGDITAVDLPSEGDSLTAGEHFGDIDSVKTVSDLIAPVSGEVVAVNEAVDDSPELVNEAPYADGWLLRIKPSDASQFDGLLDAASYRKLVAEESE